MAVPRCIEMSHEVTHASVVAFGGWQRFDQLVIATHSAELLRRYPYAVLHIAQGRLTGPRPPAGAASSGTG